MKAVSHILAVLVLVGVLVAWPVIAFCNFTELPVAFGADSVDATSSATMVVDAPSGNFTIYLNRDLHDDETLPLWEAFFRGEDVPLIMEDITCTVLADDSAATGMAESLRSRLPENQMTLIEEDSVLALSKAEVGRFDALVLSDELAAVFEASSLEEHPFVEVVHR